MNCKKKIIIWDSGKKIDLEVNTLDKISEVKELIKTKTKIPIYCQHLFLDNNKFEPIDYEIYTPNKIEININKLDEFKEIIHGIPIDFILYANRNLIKIKNTNWLVEESWKKEILYVVDLRYFIDIEKVKNLPPMEKSEIEYIYYGFIIKYFPILSFDAFKAFLEYDLIENYPLLCPLEIKIKKQIKVFNTFNKKISNDITTNVISKFLYIKTDLSLLDLTALFVLLEEISNLEICMIRLLITHSGRKLMLTKIKRSEISEFSKLYNSIKPQMGEMVIVNKELEITINKSGYRVSTKTNITDYQPYILGLVDKIAKTVNKLKIANISDISKKNIKSGGLSLNIVIRHPFSSEDFSNIKNVLEEYTSIDLIRYTTENDAYNINFIKGIRQTQHLDVENEFSYYIDSKTYQKWKQTVNNGIVIKIFRSSTNLICEVANIQENEIKLVEQYINTVYDRTVISKINEYNTMNLKMLKLKDPELYEFNNANNKLYSRLCQKQHQPILLDKQEFNALSEKAKKDATQYWNYTYNEKAWYVCPNKQFNHLSFIVNRHPKNYCIPCCKKISMEHFSKDSKKDLVYTQCIEKHEYNPDDSFISRHVKLYGKEIDVGRIGFLPSKLDKIFEGFFIVGVQQTYGTIISGVLNSILLTLELSVHEFISKIYKFMTVQSSNNFLKIDSKFTYSIVDSVDKLISLLKTLETPHLVSFYEWDDLIIELVRVVFCSIILLTEDNITEYISSVSPNYIILFKKYKKNRDFNNDFVYYPVYEMNPNAYHRLKEINNKIFTQDIKKKYEFFSNIESASAKEETSKNVILDSQNIVYALLLDAEDDKYIYWPVKRTPPTTNELNSLNINSNILAPLNEWIDFVSSKNIIFRDVIIENSNIIGFGDGSRVFYIKEEEIDNKIFNLLSSRNLLIANYNTINLKYPIIDINKAIVSYKKHRKEDPNFKKVAYSIYKSYIYKIYLIHLTYYLQSERNTSVRNYINKNWPKNKTGVEKLLEREDYEKFIENEDMNLVYQFDLKTINKINELSLIDKGGNSEHDIEQILLSISHNFITFGVPDLSEPSKILHMCYDNTCKGNKLIIEEKIFKKVITILAQQLCNNLTRKNVLYYLNYVIFIDDIVYHSETPKSKKFEIFIFELTK